MFKKYMSNFSLVSESDSDNEEKPKFEESEPEMESSTVGNAGMEKLIPAMNQILDVCNQMGVNMEFDFPQIAVIGCQSAGKSSVLENFVGRDFLPRGSDIVTRCPLILQLINADKEYGEFMHCKAKTFTDFDEIRKEIEDETERKAGNNKGVSAEAINLHIYSPHVLNLTLIDLPGMTKVAIGDQPPDIEKQIRDMILQFISKENCLILAVSPANSDLANSDALKLAKEVDPEGARTIGVITKLDLMDAGTNARDILENRKLPLRRNYVGIVNRSQRDIIENKDISAALEAESEFFAKHESYRHMAGRMGTPHLQRTLNQELTEHIRCKLPGLREKLSKDKASLEKEIYELDILQKIDPEHIKEKILQIIQKVQAEFETEIGGLGSKSIKTTGLSHGAKICEIFHDRFSQEISEIYFDDSTINKEIHFAIRNAYGYLPGEFEPYNVFECFVRKQIDQLKEPIRECIDLVVEELISAVRKSTEQVSNYPYLRDEIESKIISFVRSNEPEYKENVLSLIQMELAYVNTKNKKFKDSLDEYQDKHNRAMETELDGLPVILPDMSICEVKEKKPNKKMNGIADDMFKQIRCYMSTVKENLQDSVPKAITLYVINKLESYMKNKLLCDFIGRTNDEYLKWFTLAADVDETYKRKVQTYEACKASLDIIRSVTI